MSYMSVDFYNGYRNNRVSPEISTDRFREGAAVTSLMSPHPQSVAAAPTNLQAEMFAEQAQLEGSVPNFLTVGYGKFEADIRRKMQAGDYDGVKALVDSTDKWVADNDQVLNLWEVHGARGGEYGSAMAQRSRQLRDYSYRDQISLPMGNGQGITLRQFLDSRSPETIERNAELNRNKYNVTAEWAKQLADPYSDKYDVFEVVRSQEALGTRMSMSDQPVAADSGFRTLTKARSYAGMLTKAFDTFRERTGEDLSTPLMKDFATSFYWATDGGSLLGQQDMDTLLGAYADAAKGPNFNSQKWFAAVNGGVDSATAKETHQVPSADGRAQTPVEVLSPFSSKADVLTSALQVRELAQEREMNINLDDPRLYQCLKRAEADKAAISEMLGMDVGSFGGLAKSVASSALYMLSGDESLRQSDSGAGAMVIDEFKNLGSAFGKSFSSFSADPMLAKLPFFQQSNLEQQQVLAREFARSLSGEGERATTFQGYVESLTPGSDNYNRLRDQWATTLSKGVVSDPTVANAMAEVKLQILTGAHSPMNDHEILREIAGKAVPPPPKGVSPEQYTRETAAALDSSGIIAGYQQAKRDADVFAQIRSVPGKEDAARIASYGEQALDEHLRTYGVDLPEGLAHWVYSVGIKGFRGLNILQKSDVKPTARVMEQLADYLARPDTQQMDKFARAALTDVLFSGLELLSTGDGSGDSALSTKGSNAMSLGSLRKLVQNVRSIAPSTALEMQDFGAQKLIGKPGSDIRLEFHRSVDSLRDDVQKSLGVDFKEARQKFGLLDLRDSSITDNLRELRLRMTDASVNAYAQRTKDLYVPPAPADGAGSSAPDAIPTSVPVAQAAQRELQRIHSSRDLALEWVDSQLMDVVQATGLSKEDASTMMAGVHDAALKVYGPEKDWDALNCYIEEARKNRVHYIQDPSTGQATPMLMTDDEYVNYYTGQKFDRAALPQLEAQLKANYLSRMSLGQKMELERYKNSLQE